MGKNKLIPDEELGHMILNTFGKLLKYIIYIWIVLQ